MAKEAKKSAKKAKKRVPRGVLAYAAVRDDDVNPFMVRGRAKDVRSSVAWKYALELGWRVRRVRVVVEE